MKILLLLVVAGLAVAQATTIPPSAKMSRGSELHDTHALLSNLLQAAGYNDKCVAAALQSCSAPGAESHSTPQMRGARGMVQQVSEVVNNWQSRPRHCKDLLDSGDSGSGLRQVYPYPGRPHHRVTVYCDHNTDGGGWTVLQRRTNDTVREDFYRTWIEYQLGFGDLEGEFWLGLDLLNTLTSSTLQQARIDLHDYDGAHRYATYGYFHVAAPNTKYRLSVGRYSGDAGDSLAASQDGAPFSTHDADNDNSDQNCAQKHRGAWWYKDCHESNLNGYQYEGKHRTYGDGIDWNAWRGNHYSLMRASMMIRPAF